MSAGEDLKSSAHVWGGTNTTDTTPVIDDSPPDYSATAPESSQRPDLPVRPRRKAVPKQTYNPIQAIGKLAKIPWNRYIVPDAVLSADRTTITTSHPTFLSSLQALSQLLTDQAELPPMPMVRIEGNHIDVNTRAQKSDFDILLNLSTLIDFTKPPRWYVKPAQVVPLPGSNGRPRAVSAISGNTSGQIESMVRQFLRDKSDRKTFVLSKSVENMPTDVIEGLIRNLIASLQFRGKVNVTFPTHCGQLIVQKKPGSAGAAVGGWFMNVLGLAPDVKYDTLERVWEVGSPTLPVDESIEEDDGGEGSSINTNGSNLVKEWWSAWAPPIRDAILLKRHGKIGIEDWMEAQMGWRPKAYTQDWGVDFV